MCFLQRNVFEVLQQIQPSYELLFYSTLFFCITDHYVVSWTEESHVWPYYGFV